MTELRDALDELQSIRGHMARCLEFRGYGPTTLALTGALALATALLQEISGLEAARTSTGYVATWVAVAAVSLTLIAVETIVRSRRMHPGLAMQMMESAVEQFLPAIVAGALLTVVMVRFAPQSLSLLPGLWQILFSLGVFASCRFLPRGTFWAGVWYLTCGMSCIALGAGEHASSPWAMGVPFGLGQLIVAGVLQFGYRRDDEIQ